MNGKVENLQRYTRQLCRKTGKINLYVCFCCKEKKPDTIRLKEEIKAIKQLISDIEMKIDCM